MATTETGTETGTGTGTETGITKAPTCEFCGRTFKNGRGLGEHARWCAKNPKRRAGRKSRTGADGSAPRRAKAAHGKADPSGLALPDLRDEYIRRLRLERARIDAEIQTLEVNVPPDVEATVRRMESRS